MVSRLRVKMPVAPHAGAWIEIITVTGIIDETIYRTPRVGVE